MVSNAQFQGAVENLVHLAAHKLDQAVDYENDRLDEKIKKLENMDDDDLERLRERRLAELKNKAQQLQMNRVKGHGEYREVADTKQFFEECKQSDRVVVHFCRSTTWRCQIMDKHLRILAPKHLETKFIHVDGEKNPFLSEKLRITMLPSVVLIKNGKTDHTIIGFDEMGGDDDFPTENLEWILHSRGMIDGEMSAPESPRSRMKGKTTVAHKSLRQDHDDSDDDGWESN